MPIVSQESKEEKFSLFQGNELKIPEETPKEEKSELRENSSTEKPLPASENYTNPKDTIDRIYDAPSPFAQEILKEPGKENSAVSSATHKIHEEARTEETEFIEHQKQREVPEGITSLI